MGPNSSSERRASAHARIFSRFRRLPSLPFAILTPGLPLPPHPVTICQEGSGSHRLAGCKGGFNGEAGKRGVFFGWLGGPPTRAASCAPPHQKKNLLASPPPCEKRATTEKADLERVRGVRRVNRVLPIHRACGRWCAWRCRAAAPRAACHLWCGAGSRG